MLVLGLTGSRSRGLQEPGSLPGAAGSAVSVIVVGPGYSSNLVRSRAAQGAGRAGNEPGRLRKVWSTCDALVRAAIRRPPG